jgi:hypothetical protein
VYGKNEWTLIKNTGKPKERKEGPEGILICRYNLVSINCDAGFARA